MIDFSFLNYQLHYRGISLSKTSYWSPYQPHKQMNYHSFFKSRFWYRYFCSWLKLYGPCIDKTPDSSPQTEVQNYLHLECAQQYYPEGLTLPCSRCRSHATSIICWVESYQELTGYNVMMSCPLSHVSIQNHTDRWGGGVYFFLLDKSK